jgi:hypothetical protein
VPTLMPLVAVRPAETNVRQRERGIVEDREAK